MADRPVGVSLLEPTCIVPIIQGIGRYQDVGWVAPHFFVVRPRPDAAGYRFEPLPKGRERFVARFRAPRSEAEAMALNGADDISPDAEGLFCNVAATLRQVRESTSVKRLAVFPVNKVQARMLVNGDQRMMAVQLGDDWATARDVTVSIDLSGEEAEDVRDRLESMIGYQIDFLVSHRWRKTACVQTVNLSEVPAIDAYGLRDGASGAVALSSVKAAVRGLVSRDTRVNIEGECGDAMLGTALRPGDEKQTLSCKRTGNYLTCLYEGGFSDHPTTFLTHADIAASRRSRLF